MQKAMQLAYVHTASFVIMFVASSPDIWQYRSIREYVGRRDLVWVSLKQVARDWISYSRVTTTSFWAANCSGNSMLSWLIIGNPLDS